LIAAFLVLSFLVRYGLKLIAELRGASEPSLFAQVFAALMVAFASLILFGYWTEFRKDVARGQAATRPHFRLGCLLVLVLVSGFAFGLLVLAWNLFLRH